MHTAYLFLSFLWDTMYYIQVNSTIQLGDPKSGNSMHWVSSRQALLLKRGRQTVMLFNATHTIISGADGISSISLGSNATGSFVHVVADMVTRAAAVVGTAAPTAGDISLAPIGSGNHLVGHLPS